MSGSTDNLYFFLNKRRQKKGNECCIQFCATFEQKLDGSLLECLARGAEDRTLNSMVAGNGKNVLLEFGLQGMFGLEIN